MITEILKMSACSLVDALENREVLQSEILKDLKIRHEKIDGVVNALPTTCFERAFNAATKTENMNKKQLSDTCRPLFGLPIPIKDCFSIDFLALLTQNFKVRTLKFIDFLEGKCYFLKISIFNDNMKKH